MRSSPLDRFEVQRYERQRFSTLRWLLSIGIAMLPSLTAAAETPKWGDVGGVETVTVITENEDGESLETTIWIVMADGNGYIRTSRRSGWGANVMRNPAISVRVEGNDWHVLATVVEDEAERDRASEGFREKYGIEDAVIGIFRGFNPRIMRLDSRTAAAGKG